MKKSLYGAVKGRKLKQRQSVQKERGYTPSEV